LDSDLLPLCKPHHDIADAKRRAEGRAANERRREEAVEEDCHRWALAKYGDGYDRYDARKEYDELRGENYKAGYDPRYEDGGE
jgi:hypothetical protein